MGGGDRVLGRGGLGWVATSTGVAKCCVCVSRGGGVNIYICQLTGCRSVLAGYIS